MAEKKSEPTDDTFKWIGHSLMAVLGALALAAAIGSLQAGMQLTLVISLLVVGGVLPWLVWLSLKGNRPAWAFLISLAIVLGIMTLFGAPKVRNLVEIPLGVALLLPAAFAVAAFCLSALGDRYKS